MIKNSWDKLKLVCGNHGDDYSHAMGLHEGPHDVFYSCPEYRSIYGKDHSKRSCNNRLTLVDFERCLNKLQKLSMGESGLDNLDLTGYEWSEKGVDYKVLAQKDGVFIVAVLNKKAIAS